ncbi:MAG: hypothetical protein CVU97_06355 [Firmicutes bacterium HGW-Firmicutes-21]|nr:MAG: hypothetical protein CVU97_06355 [Firmicutes bacterium HGW-Firmicutes-21]
MKKVIMLTFIIMLVFSSACVNASKTPGILDTTAETNSLDKYLLVDLPQIQKENQRLYYVEWGKLTEESYGDSVLILSDSQYSDIVQSNVYMVADIGGSFFMHELGTFDKMVLQAGNLALADIDGDGVDEIIVHFEVSGNGGTITRIYKVINGSIILFSDLDEFDTGFTSEYENDFKLLISNKYTEFTKLLDISGLFIPDAFDENGRAVLDDNIYTDPFLSCEVKYSDQDGKYHLYCTQAVTLEGGYIGEAYTVLRYNPDISGFEIINSEFIEK